MGQEGAYLETFEINFIILITFDNEALRWLLNAPDDNRRVQTARRHQRRVRVPCDTINFGSVVAPNFFTGQLQFNKNFNN